MPAISAIYELQKKIYDLFHLSYSVEVFNEICKHCLHPVEGEAMWPISPSPRPQALGYVKMLGSPNNMIGREKKQRSLWREKMSEPGRTIKSSPCGNPRHNK
jgi:hypothetical protein